MTYDQQQPETFSASLADLRAEAGKRLQPAYVTSLPLRDIRFAHKVFQPRDFDGNRADSEGHIRSLMNAIRNKDDHLLDPVVIWWAGETWRVIDGHHRIVAYQRLASDRDKPLKVPRVPVEVFEGTLQDAIKEATSRNSKDKLNMTHHEKLERAWKLVALDHPNPPSMSKAEIMKATGTSERTIANMRKELKEVTLKDLSVNPLDLSWDEVKQATRQPTEADDEWIEKQAAEWAKRFAKTFGMKLAQNPTLTAKALEKYSEKLPQKLVAEWRCDPEDDPESDF